MEKDIKPKLFDLHTHHYRCGHAEGSIEEYVQAAIERGIEIIGISDHSPFFHYEEEQPYPNVSMGKSDLENYIKEVLHIKEKYKNNIEVLLGMESDFFSDYIEVYSKYYEKFPFDYIIGSIHYVNGLNIFDKQRWIGMTKKQILETKENYYNLIGQSAKCGLFQIMGHIDAMKGNYPEFSKFKTEVVENTLKLIADYEIAIEVNTSGNTKECGGWYPAVDVLERAFYYGVDVTFGSDAHNPNRVGEELNLVINRLKEIGFTKWCYFKQKNKYYTPL